MQSPPLEWALHVAHFGVLDLIRDRGEPDGDTASECLRVLFRVHTASGRVAFAVSLAAGGVLLYRHICKIEDGGAR
jgi:hypothetical protein